MRREGGRRRRIVGIVSGDVDGVGRTGDASWLSGTAKASALEALVGI